MNQKQALTKARKIWGKRAAVKDEGKPRFLENGAKLSERYLIGQIVMNMFFSIEADGETWGKAFEKYEEKKKAESERWAKLRAKQI